MKYAADKTEIRNVVLQFLPTAKEEVNISPLGSGNINDTFLVKEGTFCFVLQRLNSHVFPDCTAIVHNHHKITKFIPRSSCFSLAAPLTTAQGEAFVVDRQQDIWRAFEYIPHTSCMQIDTTDQAYSIGQILGRFHSLLATFPVEDLVEPLPGFHDLCHYLNQFDTLYCQDKLTASRADYFCLHTIERFRRMANFFPEMRAAGQLCLQPVHGDPKCDNFIFDDTLKACGMLDFDTVGPGLVQYDVGDCLRSCCNRDGEDGEQACIDAELYAAILSGYYAEAAATEWIYEGVLLVSFELGLRFFVDHLNGNRYFRVATDGDNLRRARQQFRLVENIASREQELRKIEKLSLLHTL